MVVGWAMPHGFTHGCDPTDCVNWQYPCGGEFVGYPGVESCSEGCCWDTCLLSGCNRSNTIAASTISTLFNVQLESATYSTGTQVLTLTVAHTTDGGASYRTLTPGASEFPAFASGCFVEVSFDWESTSMADVYYGRTSSAPDCPTVVADNRIAVSKSFNSSHAGSRTAFVYFQVGSNALGNCVAEDQVPGLGNYGFHRHTDANVATNPCEQVTAIVYPVSLTIDGHPSLPPGVLLPPAAPPSTDGLAELLTTTPPVPLPPCSPSASPPAATAAAATNGRRALLTERIGRLRRLVHPDPQYCASLRAPGVQPLADSNGGDDGDVSGGSGGDSFPVVLTIFPPLVTLVALYVYHTRRRKQAAAGNSPCIASPIRLPTSAAATEFVSPRQVR